MIRKQSNKKAQLNTVKNVAGTTAVYVVLVLFALWILIPFSIVIVTSFKTAKDASNPQFHFFPEEWVLDGYKDVFTYNAGMGGAPLLIRGFMNTLMIVLPPTILGLFCSAMSAYAFAKLRFKGKNLLFSALLMTMMIPGTIMLTPSYLIYNLLGWVDTPLPLMIPGMGYFKIFWKIMVPLSVPALLAQGILGFIGGYNDYFGPYLYLQSPQWYTLQIALNSFQGTYSRNIPAMMAGALIALIPTLVIYIVAQKYFIEGIATSGMKL